jgi:hypothetical protein
MSKIVPIKQNNLFRSLDQLAKDADHIVARHADLQNLRRAVRQQKAALANGEVVGEIIDGKRAKLSKYDETVLARCDELSELLDPPENYEDGDREGELRRNVVIVRLASMIGAFPNAKPSDPDVYVGLLLEHVCAEEGINLLALDTACRKIVATQKFVPTVSEMIAVLGEQQEQWNDRLWSIAAIAESSRIAMTEIAELQVAANARAVQQARSALDRAQHQRSKAIAELAQCEARVLDAEQALAEAQRNAGTVPP